MFVERYPLLEPSSYVGFGEYAWTWLYHDYDLRWGGGMAVGGMQTASEQSVYRKDIVGAAYTRAGTSGLVQIQHSYRSEPSCPAVLCPPYSSSAFGVDNKRHNDDQLDCRPLTVLSFDMYG